MAENNVENLVKQLRDFRTRSNAQSELVDIGEPAVPALIQALQSKIDGVRWAAATCIGKIGDVRAAPALVELLKDDQMSSIAANTLRQLSGEDLGDDYYDWRAWLNRQGLSTASEGPAAAVEEISPKALVIAALKDVEAKRVETKEGFDLTLSVAGGRKQKVKVILNAKDSDGSGLTIVYSECGPAREEIYEWALRKNFHISYGSIAIRDIDNRPTFVIFNAHLTQTATPQDLRKSILDIAQRADSIEKALTHQDKR